MDMEFIVLHFIYFAIMITSGVIFFILSNNPKKVPKIDYLIATIIVIWSGIAYLAMAIGQGYVKIENQITFYARYLDWVVTTPLLLVALSFIAMYKSKKNITLTLTLVFLDVIMILSGLIADLSKDENRYLWFLIGVTAFCLVIFIIWIPLLKLAKTNSDTKVQKLYKVSASYLTLFWFGYPITWILGPSGLNLISQRLDTYLFIILPLFSKVGFGFLNLLGLRKID